MSPEISVLLPVYNGEKYLEGCIASVLRQRGVDFELLVLDDGSTDSSMDIVRGFDDPRVRVTRNAMNLGLFESLNRLVHKAGAPLVRFFCQDDELLDDSLRSEIEFFADRPQVDFAYCKAMVIDGAGGIREKWGLYRDPQVIESSLALQYFYYYGCLPGNLSTVSARREALLAAGRFDVSYRVAGDYEMWVRMSARGSLGVIQRHLVKVRRHSLQLSNAPNSGVTFIKEARRIRAGLFDLLPEQIRTSARIYSILRPNVLDAHHCLRSLLAGRVKEALSVARILGPKEFALGILGWIATGDNRLWRPQPDFWPRPETLRAEL